MTVCPIILCGGEGSRLWPVSRRDFPKQFATLVGTMSCFQQAALRLSKMPGALKPVIVAGEAHELTVRRQLDAIGLEATVILEPEGRDSAPATAAAAAYLLAVGQDGPAVMQPADHYIPDVERFTAAVERAATAADDGYVVTFGITPSLPEVSYGYINIGEALPDAPGVSIVNRFAEKPSLEIAIEYLAQGFVWNSGIFAFRPSVLLGEMEKFEPAIVDAVKLAVAEAAVHGNVIRLDPHAFAKATKKSLDYAVMERTDRAAVVAADFQWSDLGAWSAIYGAHPKDADGNVIAGGNAVAIQSQRCFVRASNIPLAVIGLTDVGVIAEPDGIVVCKLDTSAAVKSAVENLRAKSRPEALRSTPSAWRRDHANLAAAARNLGAWLDNSALPLWWTAGADHERGGYFELLDERGRGLSVARRVRVQARQVFVYAAAGAAGWRGPWRSAVRHGLDYLRGQYRKPDGLYCTLVGEDGGQVDDRAFLYDHAFVLLALASAAKAGVDAQSSEAEAIALRGMLAERYGRRGGGFFEEEIRGTRFQSNPHMHLLEASLAWADTTGDAKWESLAEQIVDVCFQHFIDRDSGFLREFFDDRGTPVEGFPGRIVEPGHQFEWSWLLSRWARRTGDVACASAALTLFEIGERHGIDPLRGVAIDTLLDDMSLYSRQARLWPQTERLKSALILASHSTEPARRATFEAAALSAAEGLSHYLHTEVHGLWHDKMRADGTFVIEPSPASSLYHIAGAILALRDYVG
ncbi:MAG TPA: AGE family epimerase/isomerase [Rhizomicrobium sp.]|jgi:mannose-1-phosphate guanylyltransferase/mannose-6-phosphate isomerase